VRWVSLADRAAHWAFLGDASTALEETVDRVLAWLSRCAIAAARMKKGNKCEDREIGEVAGADEVQ
jgi:hypothetical protein